MYHRHTMLRKIFHVTEEQIAFLKNLGGVSVAEHVRRALDGYIKTKQIEASFSPSKKGGQNGSRPTSNN